MGIFDRFKLDKEEVGDDATPDKNVIQNSVDTTSFGEDARPLSDFNLEVLDSYEVKGKEVAVRADNGETYAGSWVREMFENGQHNPTQPTWLGYEEARTPLEGVREVSVLYDELTSHMAVFGASGNGKSTLLVNMLTQWAYSGYGFCFIDPKGQDAYKLIQKLPEHRLDDVYWIEPGSVDHDKVVGLNFLDTHASPDDPNFDNEVGQVINDLIPILQDQNSSWGARMNSIVENITRRMLEDKKNYSILDLYYLLNDPEYRTELDQYYDPEEQFTLKQKAEAIANMSQEDIEPLLRRFQTMAESRSTREVIAHKESDIDIHDIVNNDKIIILRASEADDSVQQIVATTVMRKVWSVINQRSKGDDNTPYFLVADEFHKLTDSANNIDEMLSTGRSLGLSTTISTQQPRQLGDMKEILGNVKNFITFNPGAVDDAKFLAGKLRTDPDDLMELPQYMGYANVGISEQEVSGPVKTQMFAPYPPMRTVEEAEKVVSNIVDKHGKPPLLEKEISDFDEHPLASTAQTEDGEAARTPSRTYVVTDDDDEITEEAFLKCIFDAQIQNGGVDEYVTKEMVATQIGRLLDYDDIDSDYGAKLSNAFEKLPSRFLDKVETDEMKFRLEDAARDKVFTTDSGQSSSAGQYIHREMLEEAYINFGKLGYAVDVLEQEGEMADAIAKPPINPDDAKSYSEARELDKKLEDEHPRLYKFFGPDVLNIEAEKSTVESKPKQVFKNLRKALESGNHCVFLVRDGLVTGDEFDTNARTIERWIEDQRFARRVKDGNRVFYNYSKLFTFEDGSVAARPEDGKQHSVWKEDGNKIILESPDHIDEPYATFDSIEDVKNYGKHDFPFHYIRDNTENVTRLYENDGGTTLEATYADTQALKEDGYKPIPQPFIPEKDLPKWDEYNGLPPNSYSIVIMPASGSPAASRGPQYYKNGKTMPLLAEDEAQVPYTTTESPDVFGDEEDEIDDDNNEQSDDEMTDGLNQAAMDGMMENDGEAPDFRDERDSDDSEDEETDEADKDAEEDDDDDDNDPAANAPWNQ